MACALQPGAIDRVHIRDGQVALSTIGSERPVGICGSGILNAVAQMLDAGIIDERGVLRRGEPTGAPARQAG